MSRQEVSVQEETRQSCWLTMFPFRRLISQTMSFNLTGQCNHGTKIELFCCTTRGKSKALNRERFLFYQFFFFPFLEIEVHPVKRNEEQLGPRFFFFFCAKQQLSNNLLPAVSLSTGNARLWDRNCRVVQRLSKRERERERDVQLP